MLLAPYRFIGVLRISKKKALAINLVNKNYRPADLRRRENKIYIIKGIVLQTSFEYGKNDIIFVAYISFFIKFAVKDFS
jgi:hypothetical protein